MFEDDFAYIYDRFSTIDGVTEGYTRVGGGSSGAFIAPHQGFFVFKKDGGSDDFTFTNTMRAHGGSFAKDQTNEEQLVLRISSDKHFDQTTLRIHPGAEFARDRTDARMMFSFNDQMPHLYTYTTDNVQVAINSIPEITEETTFPIGMRIPADGEYTISAQEITGEFAANNLLLEDTEKDIIHDLQSNPKYSFQAEEGDIQERFVLHFSDPNDDATSISDTETPAAHIWHHNNTLWVNSPDENTNVTLYDINGRQLRHYQTGSGPQSFQTNLPAGVYVVQLTTDTTQQSVRIVVQ